MSDNAYYLGQGKIKIATRLFNGSRNGGFLDIGDSASLAIDPTQKFDDIYESQSGMHQIASHTPIETTYNVKLQALNWNINNLTIATQGTNGGPVAAGTVSAESQMGYNGSAVALANPGVSNLTMKLAGAADTVGSVAVTAAGTGGTSGTQYALTFSGGTPTTVATGYVIANAAGGAGQVVITNPGAGYTSPITATVATITGATFVVNTGGTALVAGTDYNLEVNQGGTNGGIVDILPGSLVVPAAMPQGVGLVAAYSYASYSGIVQGGAGGLQEYELIFNGINTKDGNAPVIARCFRVSMNLAKTIELLSDKHGMLEIDGMLLPDPNITAAGQSPYFTITKV